MHITLVSLEMMPVSNVRACSAAPAGETNCAADPTARDLGPPAMAEGPGHTVTPADRIPTTAARSRRKARKGRKKTGGFAGVTNALRIPNSAAIRLTTLADSPVGN